MNDGKKITIHTDFNLYGFDACGAGKKNAFLGNPIEFNFMGGLIFKIYKPAKSGDFQ